MFFTPNIKVKNRKPMNMPIQGLSLSMDIKLVVVVIVASDAGNKRYAGQIRIFGKDDFPMENRLLPL